MKFKYNYRIYGIVIKIILQKNIRFLKQYLSYFPLKFISIIYKMILLYLKYLLLLSYLCHKIYYFI